MSALTGPFTRLPQPARDRNGISPHEIGKWLDKVWLILSSNAGIAWYIVSKAGSRLSDIETTYDSVTVTSNITATAFSYLNCDCTLGAITITLPVGTSGQEIFIRKSDASVNIVTVLGIGDIAFQGTAIHLVNNNGSWLPS